MKFTLKKICTNQAIRALSKWCCSQALALPETYYTGHSYAYISWHHLQFYMLNILFHIVLRFQFNHLINMSYFLNVLFFSQYSWSLETDLIIKTLLVSHKNVAVQFALNLLFKKPYSLTQCYVIFLVALCVYLEISVAGNDTCRNLIISLD